MGSEGMIKINWMKFIHEHVWFGYYFDCSFTDEEWLTGPPPTRWSDRLWPMRRYGEPFPTWWFKLWRIPLIGDSTMRMHYDD